MPNLIIDIKPSRTYSAFIEAPFDKGKGALEKKGYSVISLKENALLRIQEGQVSFISQNGNWTREGAIYVPSKGRFLTKNSPIMANAQEATNCHRKNQEFCLTDAQVEESLADSVKLSGHSIPTNRFAEDPVTVYAFEEFVEQYGQFLKNAGIKEMPVLLADLQEKPFARQLWFHRLICGDCSGLNGSYEDLGYDDWVRWVRQGGKATAKNLGLVGKL